MMKEEELMKARGYGGIEESNRDISLPMLFIEIKQYLFYA